MAKHILRYFFCLFLLTQQNLFAQFEEGIRDANFSKKSLSGTLLTANAFLQTDHTPTIGQVGQKINTLVGLRIRESINTIFTSNFTISVTLDVEYTNFDNSTGVDNNVVLSINYDKAIGSTYKSNDYKLYTNKKDVKLIVKAITPSGLPTTSYPLNMVEVYNEQVEVLRYYNFFGSTSTNKIPTITTTATADMLNISWSFPNNNAFENLCQIEYTWVDNSMLNLYSNGTNINYENLFSNNSTRIDIPFNAIYQYGIPLLFPNNGKVYYRVRAAYRTATGNTFFGPWTAVNGSSGSYDFIGHENNLNWQSSTSFAEEAKQKTVIQYFDGSLRPRQTVTKDNVSNNTVVAETIYDLQGRASIQILPTPTSDQQIRYFLGFNRFQGMTASQNPADFFDLTPIALKCAPTLPLEETAGNAKYYSDKNDFIAENLTKYVPNAYGYAYTETRFTDDATQRVAAQGGVGPTHQIGSGKETKYYYGKPSQNELDALFGTEVGYATHYSKNMVKDANGQMSVNYVDMHGRTVATALAGDAPANIAPLNQIFYPANPSNSPLKYDLAKVENNIIQNNAIESISTLLIPASTNVQFTYALDPEILVLNGCTQQICYDCKYDLEISIRSEEICTEDPIVRKYNNLQLNSSCTTSAGFVGEGSSTPLKTIVFNQTLTPGSYVIRKTLKISNEALDNFTNDAVSKLLCKSYDQIRDSLLIVNKALSGCENPSAYATAKCTECTNNLGNYSNYRERYLTAIGVTNFSLTNWDEQIQKQFDKDVIDCQKLCGNEAAGFSTLATIRKRMLADVTPFTGQYAQALSSAEVLSSDIAFSYNIFNNPSVSNSLKPFYRNPTYSLDNTTCYYNENGVVDICKNNTWLNSASQNDFAAKFKNSWANSLIFHHPEHTKLRISEIYLASSYDYYDKILKCNTFADAIASTNNLTTPQTHSPFYQLPVNATEKTNLVNVLNIKFTESPTLTSSTLQPISLWAFANGMVKFASIADEEIKLKTIASAVASNSINKIALDATLTTVEQQNNVWEIFKTVLLSHHRNDFVAYVNAPFNVKQNTFPILANDATVITALANAGKAIHFATTENIAANTGMTYYSSLIANPTSFTTTPPPTSVSGIVTPPSSCEAMKTVWKAKLLQCQAIADLETNNPTNFLNILDDILNQMVALCSSTRNDKNPDGATNHPTNANPNVETIINSVLATYGISTMPTISGNYFCNPYTIDYPKPHDKNLPLTHEVYSKVEHCMAQRFLQVKNEALIASGSNSITNFEVYVKNTFGEKIPASVINALWNYTGTSGIVLSNSEIIPNFLKCDFQPKCINCEELNNFTLSFRSLYSAVGTAPFNPEDDAITDEQLEINQLWVRYLNYKTGFNKNFDFYYNEYKKYFIPNAPFVCRLTASCSDCIDISKPICDYSSAIIKNFPEPDYDPCLATILKSEFQAKLIFEQRKAWWAASFRDAYIQKCLAAINRETFYANYQPKEYHYTLYYYDLGGNLVKTIPPAAVIPNFNATFLANVQTARNNGTFLRNNNNNENLATQYRYNSLNQVIKQQTPDAGISQFWYDALGRLIISQNAKQAVGKGSTQTLPTNQKLYSYTLYDDLGRITEVGQKPQSIAMTQSIATNALTYPNDPNIPKNPALTTVKQWLADNTTNGRLKEQITRTVYDVKYYDGSGSILCPTPICQVNLRNRVSYTQVIDIETTTGIYMGAAFKTATYYSYDIHGNVNELVQDYGQSTTFSTTGSGNRYKKLVYDYDLISGKVNKVSYQPGLYDQFYHKYSYDAENKLTRVLTSHNDIVYTQQAQYQYYRHGPLGRTVLGNGVQGLDYAYTIQGWLKGVNSNFISPTTEQCAPGTATGKLYVTNRQNFEINTNYTASQEIEFGEQFTSLNGDNFTAEINTTATACQPINQPNDYVFGDMGNDGNPGVYSGTARDAYGFTLGYYQNDYTPINYGLNFSSFLPTLQRATDNIQVGSSLFNGNIRSMHVSIPKLGGTMLYGYRYDQLNRITAMNAYTNGNNNPSSFFPQLTQNYMERISYDPNGNILNYVRNGAVATTTASATNPAPLAMDNLNYAYKPNTNQLIKVTDNVLANNYNNDIDDQSISKITNLPVAENYEYDEIGNLVKDHTEQITAIEWTVYGKIAKITKTNGTVIAYTYDASGNRISKKVAPPTGEATETWYVRDATGNVMSVYTSPPAGAAATGFSQTEVHLYGSSRLGIININRPSSATTLAENHYIAGITLFELSNHLGNVLATISDKKIPVDVATYGWVTEIICNRNGDCYDYSSNRVTSNTPDGIIDYFMPEVITAQDYYPFGMNMPGRSYQAPNASPYRFSINGQERSDEIFEGSTTALYWEYDSRIGRRWNLDPKSVTSISDYSVFMNNPLYFKDDLGDSVVRHSKNNKGVIVFGKDYDKDKSGTMQAAFKAAQKSNMSIIVSDDIKEIAKDFKQMNTKFENVVFAGHDNYKDDKEAPSAKITIGTYGYDIDNIYEDGGRKDLKTIGQFIKKGGSVTLLGCFSGNEGHTYQGEGSRKGESMTVRIGLAPIALLSIGLGNVDVYANQGATPISSDMFSNGGKPLIYHPKKSDVFYNLAEKFKGKWTKFNGYKTTEVGNIKVNENGSPILSKN